MIIFFKQIKTEKEYFLSAFKNKYDNTWIDLGTMLLKMTFFFCEVLLGKRPKYT